MRRERISEDIHIFTSELYAQVTATAIFTDEGAIVIDTLPFPEESRAMAEFVYSHSQRGVRFVINTHFHADHVYGNYLFQDAVIIAHRQCRQKLLEIGERSLRAAKEETPELAEVELVIPNIVFDHEMGLRLGHRILRLIHLPGHTEDGIGVLVEGDRILISGDAVMPLPYFAWGDRLQLRHTLQRIREMNLESIIQGHGDVLLRGEIPEVLDRHIHYLDCIKEYVAELVNQGQSRAALKHSIPESCGESSIPLDGLVRQLHYANLLRLYEDMTDQGSIEAILASA
ncbi:MAG: MBL fold metallo-hydrolase [Ardenticatenia bacterium]|nr:MBL fold metallo-hydrolase [Ardenticatenia bacterium]